MPYSFSVTSGSTPAGISLDGAGNLAGTPTSGGTSNFTVTLQDANSCTVTRNYTLDVNAPAQITSAASTTFIEAQAGTFTVTTTGTPQVTSFTLTGAPAWVGLTNNNDGTATLAGTPAAILPRSGRVDAARAGELVPARVFNLGA